jgi:hypothetical protein
MKTYREFEYRQHNGMIEVKAVKTSHHWHERKDEDVMFVLWPHQLAALVAATKEEPWVSL